MRPKEVLQTLLEEYFPYAEGERFSFDLLPALNAFELRKFSRSFSHPLPPEISDLLSYSRGFDFFAFDRIDFTRRDFELSGAFHDPIDLTKDAFDNHWIVDIDPEDGSWGKVFFVCHEPTVIILQAHDLAQFLSQIASSAKGEQPNWINYIKEDAAQQVWESVDKLIPREVAIRKKDKELAAFAESLPAGFLIADMREADWGDGFPWSLTGPEGEIIRADSILLFGIPAPPAEPGTTKGILGRLFNRKKSD
jgi:hypothetical protein